MSREIKTLRIRRDWTCEARSRSMRCHAMAYFLFDRDVEGCKKKGCRHLRLWQPKDGVISVWET